MRKFKVTASSNSSTLKVTPYVINKGQSGEYYGLKNAEDNQVLTSAPNNWKSKKGAIAWAKKKGYEVVESACGKKSVKASKVDGDDMTLTFITPDLSAATMVAEKAWEIGGFGSTWSEHSWVYIDVPATQSIDNIEELIDYAQNNGVYLNTKSANELDKWLGLVDAACDMKSVKGADSRCRSLMASTDKDISYRKSGGTYYFTTYDVYVGDKPVGKLEHHNRGVKQEYYVAWITKNGNYDPWKGDWETKSFDSEDEAIDWILSFQNNSIDSSCTKKSVRANTAKRHKSVKASKKFGVKASKSAKKRVSAKASAVAKSIKCTQGDFTYDFSEDEFPFRVTSYYDHSQRGIADGASFDDMDEAVAYAHEKLSEGPVRIEHYDVGAVDINPDEYWENFDGEFWCTPELAEWRDEVWKSMGIGASTERRNSSKVTAAWYEGGDKAASGYFADDLNADSNYKILQTLRTAMFDKYDGKVLDGVELQVYRPQKAVSEYSYYFKIEFVSTDDINDSISLYVISDAQSRGKFLCVLTEHGLAEPFESKWSGAQDTFKIPMSGSKNALSQEVERIAGELSDNNIGASTKRRNGTKVTAAWYEGGDIVMYFNGEKIYEGQPGADMYDAILPLCQDDETRLKFQEWCNQFGDPLFDDEYGDASETAYTFCELIYYDFVDDENNYEDGNGILDFEIFPATEEVTGAESVECASENISAAEYNQMLADMTLGILHDGGYEGIGCAVTDEALSFYDGTEDDVVYIQPTDEITPILGDEDDDAEELAAAVKSVAGKAVEAATYEDLEPITGEDEDYGYGFDSNGEAISESMVDELYRIAEREVLPTTELAKVDEYATIMEDTFEYYASSPYVGVTYTIRATFDTDDIDVVSYALPDAYHYDFRGGNEVGELEFYIYVKGNEIDKIELIWNSSNLDPNNYDMEAIEEYVKGIAKPAAEAIYNAITNI